MSLYNSAKEYYYMQLIANGRKLQDIPPDEKTYNVCLEAVKKDENALCVVPPSIKTKEFCLEAIRYQPFSVFCIGRPSRAECLYAMQHVDPSRADKMFSMMDRGIFFDNTPLEICFEALKRDINLVDNVGIRDSLKNPEFIDMVSKYVIESETPVNFKLTEKNYLKYQKFFDTIMTRDSIDQVISKVDAVDTIRKTVSKQNTLAGLPHETVKHIESYLGGRTKRRRKRKLTKTSKK
jgi:hypothetical protein